MVGRKYEKKQQKTASASLVVLNLTFCFILAGVRGSLGSTWPAEAVDVNLGDAACFSEAKGDVRVVVLVATFEGVKKERGVVC